MLVRNIDVSDGLVNGVCGVVVDIVKNVNDTLVNTVLVHFDDKKIGIKRRKCRQLTSDNRFATPIYMETDRVSSKGGSRRQFPLKLAWACTLHKVQGLTVEEAVVSLKKIFAAGQAYVALSRVKTLTWVDHPRFCRESNLLQRQHSQFN